MSDLNNNNPSNWKWGIIYYNQNDKRIFVPKRNPQTGWTINAGNPYSIILTIVFIVGMFLMIRFLN